MKELTQALVKEIFDYSPSTGYITHKTRDRRFFNRGQDWKRWNNKYAGERAGNMKRDAKGYTYRVVGIFGKQYTEHYIIWLIMKGYMPDRLGHHNRDACDNKWENIYEAKIEESNRNQSKRKDNTSGITGVHWCGKINKWVAQVRVNGKKHHVGCFCDLASAEKEVKVFRRGMGFSELHGESKETV